MRSSRQPILQGGADGLSLSGVSHLGKTHEATRVQQPVADRAGGGEQAAQGASQIIGGTDLEHGQHAAGAKRSDLAGRDDLLPNHVHAGLAGDQQQAEAGFATEPS